MQTVSQDQLEQFFQRLPLPEKPETLYEPISYIMGLGGKRVRPKLVLAGCGLCGGNPVQALNAAAAVETLHNFTLIHDDIMDNASTRRGLPTVHEKWDVATAILSGDALFAYSFELLNVYGEQDAFTKTQYATLTRLFLTATRVVCEGQARDMEFENRDDVTLNEYMLMIEQKTAALLQASLQMGAVLADASNEQVLRLGDIGLKAGIAFQIQDDLLDAIGDPEKFGKKAGGDIREGKKTYLSILALEKADASQKKLLQDVLQNKHCLDADVAQVIQLYSRLGVIEQAQKEIHRLYLEARENLDTFGKSIYKDEINSLLNQLMSRDH